MKSSYLEIVQQVLTALESDEVSTILETVESEQVTKAIAQVYLHIISGKDWPHLNTFFPLGPFFAPGEFVAKRTIASWPDMLKKIHYIKYNKRRVENPTRDQFKLVSYKDISEFSKIVESRDSTDPSIFVQDLKILNYEFKINTYNDRHPSYWTIMQDVNLGQVIIFDSWNQDLDGTGLNFNYIQLFGQKDPQIEFRDDFIFDLPTESFVWFINECLSYCWAQIKQMPNVKIEQMSQTQRRRIGWENWLVNKGIQYPNYGKRGKL